MSNNNSAIDILEKANAGVLINKIIELPLQNNKFLTAILHSPDIFSIQQEQRKAYLVEMHKIRSEDSELLDAEIDEDEFKKTLKDTKSEETKKRLIDNKPKNLAEQIANNNSMMAAITRLVPKLLKDTKGNVMFETASKQARFKKLMLSNIKYFQIISAAYIEMMSNIVKVEDEAKNESKSKTAE